MESAADDASILGGTIGGKYEVIRLLGVGGMGAVYEARNKWTGRHVAIKRLLPAFNANADLVRRFMQEAQAATQIAHPHIVDVLDMGQEPTDGSLYIVQEFLQGMDLRSLQAQRERFPPGEAISLLMPIMDALAAAHAHGIIHRDVKPENIFLTQGSDGAIVPKLIDFGVSKVTMTGADDRSKTKTGVAVGTPDYMAPEQARGDTTVDPRADVWAIGVVLYELLCGRPPYLAATANLVIAKIITEPPPRIETFAPDVPPALAAIVHRALEPNRDERYGNMLELMSALDASGLCPEIPRARTESGRMRMSLANIGVPHPVVPSDTAVDLRAPASPRGISGATLKAPSSVATLDGGIAGQRSHRARPGRGVLIAVGIVGFALLAVGGAWIGFRSGIRSAPAASSHTTTTRAANTISPAPITPPLVAPHPTVALPVATSPSATVVPTAPASAPAVGADSTADAGTRGSSHAGSRLGVGGSGRHSILRPLGRYSEH